MVEIPGGVSFPVVFFDGERETGIGSVVVYPTMEFKRFQALLSQKIGISPHQFSVHLSSPESRRRIPITGKVNFGAISREKDCFFVVALKRSRGQRRRKGGGGGGGHNLQDFYDDVFLYSKGDPLPPMVRNKNPPPNVMLLRRDAAAGAEPPLFSDRVGFENWVINMQPETERYLMNMGLSGLRCPEPNSPCSAPVVGGGGAVCEDCVRAKESGREAGFHWCIYDAVTVGFRSPAGPISRPLKGSE